jgi:hypothetical protein
MRIGAEQFTGQSGVARRHHNLHAIYRWLVTFHFTTRGLIGAAVGLKTPPVRLLRWAERAGLLAWHRYPTYGEPLLMLTEHGRREAAMLFPQAVHYRSRVTAVRMIEIAHDLMVPGREMATLG